MKKKLELKQQEDDDDHHHDHNLEILKAVAQAWHSHTGTSSPTNEFDARRLNFKTKPSRLKFDQSMSNSISKGKIGCSNWDFSQSLWDSYEIVTMSKRLEAGLVLDHNFSALDDTIRSLNKKQKESKNSLRNLFNNISSRRFNEAAIPREKDSDQF